MPRLITKLGETEYEKFGKEKMMEKRQDEVVEEKIRKLRKAKNVERRPQDHNVENKRRKLENSDYEEQKGCWGRPGEKKPEKRAEEKEKIENPKIKKMKQTKLGEKIPRKLTMEWWMMTDWHPVSHHPHRSRRWRSWHKDIKMMTGFMTWRELT